MAICVSFREYLEGDYENKKMSEIERATDGALNEELEGIYVSYVNYRGRLFRSKYQVQPKVFFKKAGRCFLLSVYPNYQITTTNPELTIKFGKNGYYIDVYLLTEKEALNSKRLKYYGEFAFQKRIVKRLRSSGRCVDYE